MLLSILINIPKFVETEIVKANMTDENNITVEVLDFYITNIRFNKEYILKLMFKIKYLCMCSKRNKTSLYSFRVQICIIV